MPLMIEALVAVLLVFTILYCMRLNRSIVQFKSQERTMKATIAELVTATETAHRAIAGLRATVRESDDTLGERLRVAEKFSAELKTQVAGAETLLKRFTQLASLQPNAVVKQPVQEPRPVMPDTQKIMQKAQAFAERARSRVRGRAA